MTWWIKAYSAVKHTYTLHIWIFLRLWKKSDLNLELTFRVDWLSGLWLWISLGTWIFLACSLSHLIPSIYIVNPTITKQYRSFYYVVNLTQIDPSWIDALLGEVCPNICKFQALDGGNFHYYSEMWQNCPCIPPVLLLPVIFQSVLNPSIRIREVAEYKS